MLTDIVVEANRDRGGGRPGCGSAVTTYVLDDNDRVRALLVELLGAAEGFVVVGSSGSADMALRDIVRLRPRVAVVDGRLPDGDGLRVCQELRTVAPEVACVVVAVGVETWGAAEAAAAGAAAYVLKDPKGFRLVEVVREVADGARPLSTD
jgi:DNA-binding NarL/FixJ family response regulator